MDLLKPSPGQKTLEEYEEEGFTKSIFASFTKTTDFLADSWF